MNTSIQIRTWRRHTHLLLAIVVLAWSGVAQADSAKVRLIEQEALGWSRNMDVLLSVFTDDVIYEDVPLGIVMHGKEQIKQFAGGFFQAFPDLKSECRIVVADGKFGFCEWRLTGTQTGDLPNIPSKGGKMDLPGISVYEFEGNKIKRTADYWDLNTLLRQLGVLPAKQ